MKILHVAKLFDPQSGGVARHIDGLARASVSSGSTVSVFAPAIAPDAAAPYARIGRDLRSAIREADIIHLHGARSGIVLGTALLAAVFGRPFVYTPHCYYDHGSWCKRTLKALWDRTAERMVAASSAAAILLDETWRADFVRRGLSAPHIAVIPNCVLEAALVARWPTGIAPRLAGSPALISIGRFDPVKRLDHAIDLLAMPRFARAHLHLVGRGEDGERLAAHAAARGVADRVKFHGPLADVDAAAALAGADAFLLCSEREGLPTVFIEALLSDIPVVASDIAGNRAVADAVGWTGLYPFGDIPALADCVGRWAGQRIDKSIQERLRQRFTWEARAAEVADLYRMALERRQPTIA